MKYTAKITIKEDIDDILKLFEPETKEFQNKRAVYSLEKKGKILDFIIEAEDSTAMRAVLNSIAKNLAVYEKTKWIKEQKKK